MAKFSIGQQISEIDRELALRGNVYPGLVSRGKMRQGEADHHMECMRSVRETLAWLQQHEAAIKAMLAEKDESKEREKDL